MSENISNKEDKKEFVKIGQKSYWNGALIGAIIGVAGGFIFKKNIFASALVGALSGAYAGAKIGEAKQKCKENAAKRIFKKK